MERYNKTMLTHGWDAFVDAHHLEENDSMLFQHIENSVFEVLVLDSDGCEKTFCCSGIKNTPPSVGKKSAYSVDISSSSQHDTTESSGSKRFGRYMNGSSSRQRRTSKMAATSSSSGEDIPSEGESFESDDLETPPGEDYVISCRSHLSQEQKERVVALIQEIQPKVTVYVVVMRKSHVHPQTAFAFITREYASAHFPHGVANVTLQRPGKSKEWHPTTFISRDESVYRLQGQWSDFVRDNHVQEDDICLFLPTKGGRRFTFTVYLLRQTATHYRHGAGSQRGGRCSGGPAKVVSEDYIEEELTYGEHVSLESSMHEISHKLLEKEHAGSPSLPPCILPFRHGLSKSQKKIVEERVRAIQSEVPIYVAILRKSSTLALDIGSRYAAAVNISARRQTLVLHCMRKMWKINMIHKRQRHFLSGGWPRFVRDNCQRAGDICMFELKRNERKLTSMMVHIIPREQL